MQCKETELSGGSTIRRLGPLQDDKGGKLRAALSEHRVHEAHHAGAKTIDAAARAWRDERIRRIAEAKAHKARTGHYPFEDRDRVYALTLLAEVLAPIGGGGVFGATSLSGTASAYGGIVTGMGLSFAITAPLAAGAALVVGEPSVADKAVAAAFVGASPGALIGCLAGIAVADDAATGCLVGSTVGGTGEGIANLRRPIPTADVTASTSQTKLAPPF